MSWAAQVQASDDNLEIEGTIYPPSQSDSAPRTVGHLCSEYTTEELEECIPLLKDLQLCLEHDTDTVIGKVVDASLTASKGMWIKAVVSASSAAGKETIRRIKAQKLPGLSLSHDFHLFAKPGSQLQQLIQTARDWQRMPHDGSQASCHKTLRELSVCREPAREGCYIHKPLVSGIVSCSQDPRLKPLERLLQLLPQKNKEVSPTSTQDNVPLVSSAGGACYIFPHTHALPNLGIACVGVCQEWTRVASGICSFSLEAMEAAPQQTQQAPAVDAQQMAPQAAAAGGTAGNPVFAAVAQQQQAVPGQQQAQQQAQQPPAQATINRDAQGRFITRNDTTNMASAVPETAAQPPVEQQQALPQETGQPVPVDGASAPTQNAQNVDNASAPQAADPSQVATPQDAQQTQQTQQSNAMSEAQQQEAIANAMQQAQETILAQKNAQEEAAKAHASQMATIQKQLEDQQKQMAEIQKIKEANEAQLEKVRHEQQAAATANKQRMLAQLNATLNTIGSAQPGQSVVLPQPPQGDAAMDVTKQSEYEAKLMDTTINTMQALQQQSTTANMEAQNNKRTASDALAAGYNFHTGGAQMPMQAMQMGTVNCSKDEAKHQHRNKRIAMDPSKDKNTVLGDQIREWYAMQKQNNARVDFNDCARQFNSMSAQLQTSAVMGTVSASKDGMWTGNSLLEGSAPSASLCMQHMQPQLFSAISDLNPGRIIGPEETRAMMNTIQVAPSMPRR